MPSAKRAPIRLRDGARIELRGIVVDLRDAEVARLEILNEALDPLFAQIPDQVDLFDRTSARAIRRGCGSTSSPMF